MDAAAEASQLLLAHRASDAGPPQPTLKGRELAADIDSMDEPSDAAPGWSTIDGKVLLPGLLGVVFVAVFAGVGTAAKTRSLLLTFALPAAVVATLAVWMTWTWFAKRFAQRSPEVPGRAARDACPWADFERAFWSYVESSPDASKRAAG